MPYTNKNNEKGDSMNWYFEKLKHYVISGGQVSKKESRIFTSRHYCRFFVGLCRDLCWIFRSCRYYWDLRFICTDSQHRSIGQEPPRCQSKWVVVAYQLYSVGRFYDFAWLRGAR